MSDSLDTITAIATPPGKGGVGVIRVSGPLASIIAQKICGTLPEVRRAHFCQFRQSCGLVVDEGLALFFRGPHSFTGEDVLELQGHGGPVVLNTVLQCCLDAGARLARPGEFSERAFLNGKMDLVQAEAVADLIDAQTTQAAKSAMRSLQGDFSNAVHHLVELLIRLRMFVESAIDFPDEDIEFIENSTVKSDLQHICQQLEATFKSANQGVLLKEGVTVVIAGKPNAGKSSLLNVLAGQERAIVTDIAGTTRDVLREQIHIDGLPLHIIDTAGIRETSDAVEKEGVKRARVALAEADLIIWLTDITSSETDSLNLPEELSSTPVLRVFNKSDLAFGLDTSTVQDDDSLISAKTGEGIEAFKAKLKNAAGFVDGESTFIARTRHLEALMSAKNSIENGLSAVNEHEACELLAEELFHAQQALSMITGEFTSDDLLGEIFSTFCIGK